LDRRHFVAATGSAAALGLAGCGSGGGAPAAPPPPPGPNWSALASQMQGSVLLPDAAGFTLAAPVFNAVYDATLPQALVRVASASDVTRALAFARANGLALTVRSGGHGYTGDSTTTGMVIDVGALDSISLGNGTATIGAGAKLADRASGLTCACLVSAQVVLADGSVVTCDASTHVDLFWALRGGGGGHFGVVTAMTFDTFATSDLTRFSADFAWADAANVIAAWQAWPLTLPDTIWSGLLLAATSSGSPVIEVSGVCIGTTADFDPHWARFLAAAGVTPTAQSAQTQPFHTTLLAGCNGKTVSQCHLAGETADGQVPRGSFVASSDFFDTALPAAGIQALLGQVSAAVGVMPLLVIMDLMGGAIADVAPDATAFVHRNALFSAQYYVSGPVGAPSSAVALARQVASGARAAMSPWSSGEAYQNYLDPTLTHWQAAYYGANYARLVQVKAAHDPTRVFNPAQGIATNPAPMFLT
jgi:FAD/FMN-containing dehydrogenase